MNSSAETRQSQQKNVRWKEETDQKAEKQSDVYENYEDENGLSVDLCLTEEIS